MVSHPDSARTRPDPDSNERYVDPVIEAYKKDVDRTLIRENEFVYEVQRAGRVLRGEQE